jgi:hypothetical protein
MSTTENEDGGIEPLSAADILALLDDDTPSGPSAPAGPARDVYIADLYDQDAVKRTKATSFAQVYQQMWGEPATEEYIMSAVNDGLNVWEFADNERHKPAFVTTKTFKDGFGSIVDLLKQLGVAG